MSGDDVDDPVAAVRDLFDAHAIDLHAYASRRVGRDLADDVVAETFRQAIESWDRYDADRGSARGWLFGIEANLLRRHWRVERRRLDALARSGVGQAPADQMSRTEDRLDASERIRHVLDAVAELGDGDRELLGLVAWERMPHDEVAEVLSIPVGTVRSRLHRIRRRLEAAVTSPQNDSDDPKGDRR